MGNVALPEIFLEWNFSVGSNNSNGPNVYGTQTHSQIWNAKSRTQGKHNIQPLHSFRIISNTEYENEHNQGIIHAGHDFTYVT